MPIQRGKICDLDGTLLIPSVLVYLEEARGGLTQGYLILDPADQKKLTLIRRYHLTLENGQTATFTVTQVSAKPDGTMSVRFQLTSSKLG